MLCFGAVSIPTLPATQMESHLRYISRFHPGTSHNVNYWVEKRGKEADANFKTDKDMIRERLDALVQHAESLDHMIYYLEHVEDWQIRETNKTISFRMPHMKKSIHGKSLGEKYDKAALEKRIAEAIALKEEKLKAEQKVMREETYEVAEEQVFAWIPVEESDKDVHVQAVVTSPEPDYVEELAELQSRFICLQYEIQYNLDKISNLDYEHRYRNPEYITYQANVLRIMDKSSYINQWTVELAKCGLFQKELKKMYKEQIDIATAEVKRIEEENKRILDKAGCRSESELYAKQQAYDKNWSLCNTLAERNRSIKEECEGIFLEYAQLFRGAEGVLNGEGFGNNKLIDEMAGKKAKIVLKEMYGNDFSEYGFQDAWLVLRQRRNYKMRTKTEVMKEVFESDKIERGLPHIVVQASIFLEKITICNRKC